MSAIGRPLPGRLSARPEFDHFWTTKAFEKILKSIHLTLSISHQLAIIFVSMSLLS